MRRVLVPTTYFVLAVAAVALLVLNIFAWNGGLIDEEPQPAPEAVHEPTSTPTRTSAPAPDPRERPAPHNLPGVTSLTISANRGDCWVEVRAGSPSGALLYAGTLVSGKTLRFNREKLWLRLGAASNVDVVVNGRPSIVPPGTVELLLPA
jgi:hypothetical protein